MDFWALRVFACDKWNGRWMDGWFAAEDFFFGEKRMDAFHIILTSISRHISPISHM